MAASKNTYRSIDLAVLVPTKDRPQKIQDLLNSLKVQTVPCGRIVVVDGGQSVKDIVMSYSDCLSVEYYEIFPPGQIRQRNKAISLLDNRTRLAAFLDDDIILDPEAIESIISFWNNCEPETAGVSFNIVNNPPFRHTWIKGIAGMSSPEQGKVLSSGYNVAISPVNKNIKVQWLCGGATVWKNEILNKFVNKEVFSKWAICEDVNFSYPIGKKYPLYVCTDAKVRHEHLFDHTSNMKFIYYGKTATIWRLYFVKSNPELSLISFFWMILWQILARLFMGLFLLRLQEIQYGFGQIEGAVIGINALLRKSSLLCILNENQDK